MSFVDRLHPRFAVRVPFRSSATTEDVAAKMREKIRQDNMQSLGRVHSVPLWSDNYIERRTSVPVNPLYVWASIALLGVAGGLALNGRISLPNLHEADPYYGQAISDPTRPLELEIVDARDANGRVMRPIYWDGLSRSAHQLSETEVRARGVDPKHARAVAVRGPHYPTIRRDVQVARPNSDEQDYLWSALYDKNGKKVEVYVDGNFSSYRNSH